ncbi:MAG: hypothetical protein ACRD2A_07800, partial [Vicinamibacterales bacterium]
EHVHTLWRTDLFRRSHDDAGGFVRAIIDRFAVLPRVFYDMSEPEIEASHFSVWFNAISRRPWYDNDAVSDLYYLHEFKHAAGMTYQDGMPWNRWFTKMVSNEFEASFCTEVQAYFELPGLRERSFPFDIWADRFLGDRTIGDRWTACKGKDDAAVTGFWAPLRARRKEVMVKPDPFDFIELQIRAYVEQNLEWVRIWQRSYALVEAHMSGFVGAVAKGADWPSALKSHEDWLASRSETGVPFRREAKEFARIYQANKARYGNVHLSKAATSDAHDRDWRQHQARAMRDWEAPEDEQAFRDL